MAHHGWANVEVWGPHSVLTDWGENEAFFSWPGLVIIQKFCVLLGCSFPGPLAKKSRFFWRCKIVFFIVYARWCFWIAGFNQASGLPHPEG